MGLHIDYFVSLNSPWTHLGAARLEAMVARHSATLRIYPVEFGTIFSASGGLPLPKRSPQRQAYRMQELGRWRDHLGIPIHLQPGSPPDASLPRARQSEMARPSPWRTAC
jgi:carboxymethylenebutenolidase